MTSERFCLTPGQAYCLSNEQRKDMSNAARDTCYKLALEILENRNRNNRNLDIKTPEKSPENIDGHDSKLKGPSGFRTHDHRINHYDHCACGTRPALHGGKCQMKRFSVINKFIFMFCLYPITQNPGIVYKIQVRSDTHPDEECHSRLA